MSRSNISTTVRFMILCCWRRKYFKTSELKKSCREDFDNSVEVANVAAVVEADVVETRQS